MSWRLRITLVCHNATTVNNMTGGITNDCGYEYNPNVAITADAYSQTVRCVLIYRNRAYTVPIATSGTKICEFPKRLKSNNHDPLPATAKAIIPSLRPDNCRAVPMMSATIPKLVKIEATLI